MSYFLNRFHTQTNHAINKQMKLFANANEYIQYGAYCNINIHIALESPQSSSKEISIIGKTSSIWENVFNLDDYLFLGGNPYDDIARLDKDSYELSLSSYIKRNPVFLELNNEVTRLAALRNANDSFIKIIQDPKTVQIKIMQLDLKATLQTLQTLLDLLNNKYSFLSANFKTMPNNDNKKFQDIEVSISYDKPIAKNVKLDAEVKRLMTFDILEACEYVLQNKIDLEDSDMIQAFTKQKAVESLARFLYPNNPLESAKNQVYKLHREAKQRVYNDGLERYF